MSRLKFLPGQLLVLLLAAGIVVRIALVPITRGQDFDVWDIASTATLQGSDIYTHHPAYPGGTYAYFPLFLYLNQLANSVIKGYLVFRPATQRWLNRGDQRARTAPGSQGRSRERMADYVMVVWVTAIGLVMALYIGILRRPSWDTLWHVFHKG